MSTPDPRKGTHYQITKIGYFVLIGSQRSGTNFFREVVNTNQHAIVHGEVLWPYPLRNVWHNYLRTMVSRAQPAISPADCTPLVDDYFVHLADDSKRGHPEKASQLATIGIDVKYNQLGYIRPLNRDLGEGPFLLSYLRDRKIPIIHMMRRNTAHQALSLAISEARNVYHNYGGGKFEGQIEVKPERVVSFAQWVQNQKRIFKEMTADHSVLDVYYEDVWGACKIAGESGDITANPEVTKIAKFLELPGEFSNPTSIKKVINRPYREILSNYSAVVKAIERSDFREFASTVE